MMIHQKTQVTNQRIDGINIINLFCLNLDKYENESVNQSLPNIGLEPKKKVDSILTSDKTCKF